MECGVNMKLLNEIVCAFLEAIGIVFILLIPLSIVIILLGLAGIVTNLFLTQLFG